MNTSLVSLRISNIYDLSSRIFLFKCAKPGTKAQFLVDSGFRAHLTGFTRTAASAPSQFVARLRKYLKSRRITKVSQIGTDRVIEIAFSDGQYRLFLEFFAAGNIVLTDAELNVLALLRQVNEGDQDVDVKLGGKYVLEAKQNFHGIPPITRERIKETLERQAEKAKEAQDVGGKKAKRHKAGDELRKALSVGFPEFPPHLLEHAFTVVGLDVKSKIQDVLDQPEGLQQVLLAMTKAGEVFQSLETSAGKGYIFAKTKQAKSDAQTGDEHSPTDSLLYDDFHPYKLAQLVNHPDTKIVEFDNFNKTVDEFYSSIESQKLESRLTEKEEAARKKLDEAKQQHEKRLAGLQQVQEMHIRKAEAIEANTHRVEEAIAAVNGLIGQGMDWMDIEKLIANEQRRNNIVAQMIKLPLKLYENTVTILLDEAGAEDSEDEGDVTDDEVDSSDDEKSADKPAQIDKRLAIDVDLALSGYANARQYYDSKKVAAQKEQKTVAASEKALKSMQKKTEADLKKGLSTEKAALRVVRKQFWFEKFYYFISSDGYLVLGGKDAQQNELLYRRYLKKGDVYVHADLHGASSVIVKNNPQTPDAPVPPSTLSQAGALSVCSSSAWDSKAVMAAWWVNAEQVSKTAPTGEYLTTGGFVIRGQKNFLPPSQLLLGFAVHWLISEESRVNHGKHRLARTESMLDGEAEMLAADARGLDLEDDRPRDTSPAVPDIETAAESAAEEEEVEEDDTAAEDDVGETADEDGLTDNEKTRSNPLQANKSSTTRGADSDDDQSDGARVSNHTEKNQPKIEVDPLSDPKAHDDTDEAASTAPLDSSATSTKASTQPEQSPSGGSSKQKPGKRGANTKAAKRRAAKYALQDEDDKALAMELLGSTKAAQRQEAEQHAREAREAKAQADRERRRAQHQKAADAEKARQERLEKGRAAGHADGTVVAEDNDEDLGDANEQAAQERAEHLNIDLLVPHPEPGDELVAAIPVVAPWTALGRCKYKVKLQPGNMKKGKAMKEILGNWTNMANKYSKYIDEKNQDKEKVWAREVELIKGLKPEEVVGVVPVKGVRIVQGGGIGAASSSSSGGGKGKTSARGGKGSKKSR